MVGVLLAVLPVAAMAEGQDPLECGDDEKPARDEGQALDQATACGSEVLILDSRDYKSRSYAQPDGTIATELFTAPRWVPNDAGEWVDADPAVIEAEDGNLQSKATVVDLEFGSEGDTDFVSAVNQDGESVSLSWAEPLPEPVVEGTTVRYSEVLPDVDLEVYSKVDSFSYSLVVKTSEAASRAELERVELDLRTEGLSVDSDAQSDTAVLRDDRGEDAFSVAQPQMWDSSKTGDGEPGRVTPMELEIDGDSVAVVPDDELLGDPEAEYPIFIDPEFIDTGANYKNVYSEKTGITCGGDNVMCTGRQTWKTDNTYGHWRSAMRFYGLNTLQNREIQQATVWIDQIHTGAAGGALQTVRLASMRPFGMGETLTWDEFNGKIGGEVARARVATSNDNYGESDQRIQWADSKTASQIQHWVDIGENAATFSVISGADWNEEEKHDYWRKLDSDSAKLKVWHAPVKPTGLKVEGEHCSTSAPGAVIDTVTPALTAIAPPSLESDNQFQFYVMNRDDDPDAKLEKIIVDDVGNSQSVSVRISAGKLQRGKTYRWNSRASDSDGNSKRTGEFTNYCYFTVNSLPEVPSQLQTDWATCGSKTDPTLVTTSTPKLSVVPHDPDGGAVQVKYRFYRETGDNIKEWSRDAKDGVVESNRLTQNLIDADGLYRWRAATLDSFTTSPWSQYCWLRVDTTAPEPPDIVQMTENPTSGDAVQFELVGSNEVTAFEYVLEGQPKKTVQTDTGRHKIEVTPTTSSVDHVLQVSAIDAAGNTSSPTKEWFTTIGVQPAEANGTWRFDGDLADDADVNDLSSVGSEIYGDDRKGRSQAAAVFDGSDESCVRADSAIVDTTDSFTIAGWVNVPDKQSAEMAIMDVTGNNASRLKLALTPDGQWAAVMLPTDTANTPAVSVLAESSVTEYGTWTHLAGVYDVAAERLRLYVNGSLEGSNQVTIETWKAEGVFSVGCGVTADGAVFNPMTGSVDDAVVFPQVLTSSRIAALMEGDGLPAGLQAWYPLRGDGEDHSRKGNDLEGMPASPVWGDDQYGRAGSSLQFDGSVCPKSGTVPVRSDSGFSVSAWVKLDPNHVDEHPRVFSFYGQQHFSVILKFNSSTGSWNSAVTASDNPDAGWGHGAEGTEIAIKGEWVHLAVVLDADDSKISLYADGALAGSGSISQDWDTWRASTFAIGCGVNGNEWEGSITDVKVWRGTLSADDVSATHVERTSMWEMDEAGQGGDQWGTHDLSFEGTPGWEVDRFNKCWAMYGLKLGGTDYAYTSNPVVATDESFTVAAWARVDDLSDYRTVMSQSAETYGAFNLNYNPVVGRFQFSMPQTDSEDAGWTRVVANEAPYIDEAEARGHWYHLVGQVDLGAGVIRLYVDGELQGEAPVVDSPWKADGPVTIGAADQLGGMRNFMVGGIDEVRVWSGAVDSETIADIASVRPQFEIDPDQADCSEETEPPVDL